MYRLPSVGTAPRTDATRPGDSDSAGAESVTDDAGDDVATGRGGDADDDEGLQRSLRSPTTEPCPPSRRQRPRLPPATSRLPPPPLPRETGRRRWRAC